MVGLEVITVSQDIDIVDDHDNEWVDDRSKPEVEFDDEQQQSYEQTVTIQDVDRESIKYMKTEREDPSWAGGATTHSGF